MKRKKLQFRQESYYLLRTASRLLAFDDDLSTDDYMFISERLDDCIILLEKQREEWEPKESNAEAKHNNT